MKTVAQILLVIFFVTTYIFVIISATIKFNVLNYDFLTHSFNDHDVYLNLANIIKGSIELQVNKGGGNITDISLVTDLITPENTSDFVNKNLFNLLSFVNGKSEQMEIYIPIDKVPKNLVPKSIVDLNQSMTLEDFGKRFNISGLENMHINELRKLGIYDYYLLMISTSISGVLLIILFVIVQNGKRFVAPGLALIISGLVTFLFAKFAINTNKIIIQNFTDSVSINKTIVLTVIPTILNEIVKIYINVGIVLIIVGVAVVLLKKKLPY